jgi:Ser/Thr protein kinase RdoA (MazF antagonist)
MNHFPVTASVLSDIALEKLIRAQYGLPTATCKLIKTFVNDTYLVTEGQTQFIFRVYTKDWRSPLEINEELRVINTVKSSGMPVAEPIADTSGNYTQKFFAPEGERHGVLFSYATGEKKFNAPESDQQSLGSYMANMHKATLGMKLHRVEYDAVTMLVYAFEKFESYLKGNSEDLLFIKKAKQLLMDAFKNINMSEVRTGAVHLDFWADNLHMDTNGNITLFDFDFCGNGILVLDIAFYLQMLQSMEPDENIYKKKAESFLIGYEHITALTQEEKRIIPILGACVSFYYMGAQADRFATVFFNAEHLKRFINLRLKRWMRAYDLAI